VVNCLRDPCDGASCGGIPGAHCVSDYCGGCNARWYNDDDEEVTDQCAVDCSAVLCVIPDCVGGVLETPPNQCCPICTRNCSEVIECPQIRCENAIPPNFAEGRCCPTCPTGPAPCDGIRCMNGYRCEVYQPTNETYCEPDCETLNPCLPGELCEVEQVLCKRAPCPGKLRCRDQDTV
jgi:hypothetical protein